MSDLVNIIEQAPIAICTRKERKQSKMRTVILTVVTIAVFTGELSRGRNWKRKGGRRDRNFNVVYIDKAFDHENYGKEVWKGISNL